MLTKERKKGNLIGSLFVKNGDIFIYRIESEQDLKRFSKGVVAYNLDEIFNVVDRVVKHENRH